MDEEFDREINTIEQTLDMGKWRNEVYKVLVVLNKSKNLGLTPLSLWILVFFRSILNILLTKYDYETSFFK